MTIQQTLPKCAGIGLRSEHFTHIGINKPDVAWFEVLTENYMGNGGMPVKQLEKISAHYPISFHGVGMSLASTDPLNMDYMKKLKAMIKRFQPLQVSDHLAWVSVHHRYANELLPIPYSQASLEHLTEKISIAQDYLGQQLLIENPSSYMQFKDSDMTEWDFISQLVMRSNCKLLLDVNNVYVSAYNTGFSADHYIQQININEIDEIHLAGFEDRGNHLYDTHGDVVDKKVWDLYQKLIQRTGPVASLIEWDTDIPDFSVLQTEAQKAQDIINQYSSPTITRQAGHV